MVFLFVTSGIPSAELTGRYKSPDLWNRLCPPRPHPQAESDQEAHLQGIAGYIRLRRVVRSLLRDPDREGTRLTSDSSS